MGYPDSSGEYGRGGDLATTAQQGVKMPASSLPPAEEALGHLREQINRLEAAIDGVRSAYKAAAKDSTPAENHRAVPVVPGNSVIVTEAHELACRVGYLVDQINEFAARSEVGRP